MVKRKFEVVEKGNWCEPVKQLFAGAKIDFRDGIKVLLHRSWVHIRESNTEPIVRIISEAPDADEAMNLVDRVIDAIGSP
jgi:phosphomannomutase